MRLVSTALLLLAASAPPTRAEESSDEIKAKVIAAYEKRMKLAEKVEFKYEVKVKTFKGAFTGIGPNRRENQIELPAEDIPHLNTGEVRFDGSCYRHDARTHIWNTASRNYIAKSLVAYFNGTKRVEWRTNLETGITNGTTRNRVADHGDWVGLSPMIASLRNVSPDGRLSFGFDMFDRFRSVERGGRTVVECRKERTETTGEQLLILDVRDGYLPVAMTRRSRQDALVHEWNVKDKQPYNGMMWISEVESKTYLKNKASTTELMSISGYRFDRPIEPALLTENPPYATELSDLTDGSVKWKVQIEDGKTLNVPDQYKHMTASEIIETSRHAGLVSRPIYVYTLIAIGFCVPLILIYRWCRSRR